MKDNSRNNIIVVNPKIVKRRGKRITDEGCLSIPGLFHEVPDRDEVTEVIFYDENMMRHHTHLKNLECTVFNHEYDHTQGILFVDRITKEGREKIADKLAEIESGKIQTHYPMIFSLK